MALADLEDRLTSWPDDHAVPGSRQLAVPPAAAGSDVSWRRCLAEIGIRLRPDETVLRVRLTRQHPEAWQRGAA